MATKAKKMNIFRILFASGIDVEDYEETTTLPKELADAKKAIATKEVESGFNSGKAPQNVSGKNKKIDQSTLLEGRVEVMRPQHDEIAAKANKTKKANKNEIEIGD